MVMDSGRQSGGPATASGRRVASPPAGAVPGGIRAMDRVIARAQAGDAQAVTWLYRAHAPGLRRYFSRRLGGHEQQAEDLTADVFVRALERLNRYECRGVPFSAWLFRIAHNVLVDHRRAQPRGEWLGLDDCGEIQTPAAERELAEAVELLEVGRALRRLTPEQREVVALRFVRGCSIAETQAATGRSEDAVKKLQARGLQRLRKLLRPGTEAVTG